MRIFIPAACVALLVAFGSAIAQDGLSDKDKACLAHLNALKKSLPGECSSITPASGKLLFNAVSDTTFCAGAAIGLGTATANPLLGGGAFILCKGKTLHNIMKNATEHNMQVKECKEMSELLKAHEKICGEAKYIVLVDDEDKDGVEFLVVDKATLKVIAKYRK